ncbi:hypothetical protein [Vogesella oryzae]|uniref:hypothetical protein n=1 Tax=Vogesella oryzae TaxID=1735285 RepID=UPI001581B1D4|nr:hypothetical protein [Vogesella oryzae]
MDKHPLARVHLETLLRLSEEYTSAVRRIDLHRWDYINAENLAAALALTGHHITVTSTHSPLRDISPQLLCSQISKELIAAITQLGFRPFKNGDHWQVNPPACAGDNAMSFTLLERP